MLSSLRQPCEVYPSFLSYDCFFRTTHFCILRARPPQELKETTPTTETRTGIKSIVIYEDPPPYESQTVSLHFGHDTYDERDLPPEMPAFIESNKVIRLCIAILL